MAEQTQTPTPVPTWDNQQAQFPRFWHEGRIKASAGWPRKLPADLSTNATWIDGVKVWVISRWRAQQMLGGFHRVMGECPYCSQIMSAGRLTQHGWMLHKEELRKRCAEQKFRASVEGGL